MHYTVILNHTAVLFVDRNSHKMVRILSSGEIVHDNDPRLARQTGSRGRPAQVCNADFDFVRIV